MPEPPTVEEAVGALVAKRPDIAAAWIFGSVARGDERNDSDLDVAVLLRAGTGPSVDAVDAILRELAIDLEPYSPSGRVDVVILGRQGPIWRHRVLTEGKLVHDADRALRVDFEGRTISEYLDWTPTHDIAMRSVFGGLRERFARSAR